MLLCFRRSLAHILFLCFRRSHAHILFLCFRHQPPPVFRQRLVRRISRSDVANPESHQCHIVLIRACKRFYASNMLRHDLKAFGTCPERLHSPLRADKADGLLSCQSHGYLASEKLTSEFSHSVVLAMRFDFQDSASAQSSPCSGVPLSLQMGGLPFAFASEFGADLSELGCAES